MASVKTNSLDNQILHQALESRLLNSIEFVRIAAEISQLDISADEFLLAQGIINDEQRDRILKLVASQNEQQNDDTQQHVGSEASSQPANPSVPPPTPSLPRTFRSSESSKKFRTEETGPRYEWVEKFAQGGLGAVWRARDSSIDRSVALKEILPKAQKDAATVEQFLDEARITGQLQHPGVVPVYDIGTNEAGSPFYIMKFVEGQTLHEAIQLHHTKTSSTVDREASLRRLLTVFINICRTMDYAHDKGFIHRDLKPRNVMLGDYGETLVVDWGLAKTIEVPVVEEVTVDMRNSKSSRSLGARRSRPTSGVVGTPAYLAPEQARGEIQKMDARSDIYSLGVVLFEILTGTTPYTGSDSRTIIASVLKGDFLPPREIKRTVASPLNSICIRAMQSKKENRYQSCRELADEIERFLAGERVLSHVETFCERAQRTLAKHRQAALASIVSLLVLTTVVAGAAWQINAARRDEVAARIAAEVARESEAEARKQETIAKSEAVANLRSAVDAIDTWLLKLSGDLEFYPGLTERRTEFLSEASVYYSALASSNSADPVLKTESARAAIRGGDTHQLLGHPEKSVPMFDEAIDWFRRQSESDGKNREYRRELANSLIGKAIASTATSPTVAAESIQEATKILRFLASENTQDTEVQSALARSSVAAARLALTNGDRETAIRQFEDARRRLFDIVQQPEIPARYHALYHTTLFELIDLYKERMEFDSAKEIGRDAIRSFDSLIAAFPRRPDYFEGRMAARILLGNIREALQQNDEALCDYRLATEDYNHMIKVLYRSEYQSENLAAARINQGRILLKRGDVDEATRILTLARNELGQLVQLHGQQLRLLKMFSAAAMNLADANVANADWQAAKTEYAGVVQVTQHLIDQGLATADERARLAVAHRELAKLAAAEGKVSIAQEHCERAIQALTTSEANARTTNDRELMILATCYLIEGQLKPTQATEAFESAMGRLQGIQSDHGEAMRALVGALFDKEFDPNLDQLESLASRTNKPDAWYAYAIAAYSQKQFKKCLKALERYSEFDGPRSPTVNLVDALCWHHIDETAVARKLFSGIQSQTAFESIGLGRPLWLEAKHIWIDAP